MLPEPATMVAGVMALALLLYALTGGADFGGGVWDLLATGPRKHAQRRLAAKAIAPIWEVNHVWMILVVVLLFVGFPKAFAAISISLHVPLTLMLIGIVLRGTAFTFQHYGIQSDETAAHWRRLFAVASTVTPVLLGVIVGACVSGRISVAEPDFFTSWVGAFPLALGGFFLALCAWLAAVYLTVEAKEAALQEDFRRRGICAGLVVGGMAAACLLLAKSGAPLIYEGLVGTPRALAGHAVTGLAALSVFGALWTRRYRLARALAVLQTAGIFAGWGFAQAPWLVVPDLTIAQAAAPDSVLVPALLVLGGGSLLLVPALVWLMVIFKRT